jgi:hypothetical protein
MARTMGRKALSDNSPRPLRVDQHQKRRPTCHPLSANHSACLRARTYRRARAVKQRGRQTGQTEKPAQAQRSCARLAAFSVSKSYDEGRLDQQGGAPIRPAAARRDRRVKRRREVRECYWLPGMDSNHELDRFCKHRNLLILQSRKSYQKHQNHALCKKSVQFGCARLVVHVVSKDSNQPTGIDPLRAIQACPMQS